ncbi:GNAT family N-acetyltransferase [Streptomyces sp. ME01-24h]|nr:GNAT family N-acetyltransferase [Streptomyces sp. ME19-03-3]MDX3351829.1 GNAT family N-acetyltransferase [Streptomyces sp. ME01-24h]
MTDSAAIRIRPARAADADAITAVFLASRAAAMPWLPRLHSDEETRWWVANVVLEQCRVWVAEQTATGAVTGFAALEGDWLEHLYLRPGVRGRGIGSRLLGEVVRHHPDGPLSLHVFRRNTAARGFYERHGFRAVPGSESTANEEGEQDLTYRLPPRDNR